MTAADRWIGALHDSSRRLRQVVDDLPADRLAGASFAKEWTIGQVLSHLGSGAEICTTLVERGLKGDLRGPVREELAPVWERWDALSPVEQRAAWREADERHLALLDSVDAAEHTSVRVPYFTGPLDLSAYAGYRLSEQVVHAWDVAVTLDAQAVIAAPDVRLLWGRIDLVAARFRDTGALTSLAPQCVQVEVTDPQQTLLLDIDAELHLYPARPTGATGFLTGPAESVLRLVYGRNRPQDPVTATGSITLDDLRALFPGF
ncbi:maleylpyruvate isomerase family mycothiol-dependent enzyme [Streptomyces sp. NBC_01092]|uniref:maleylpyruvate isomerase family mycothiol-dependent enzyme n=1 Tax=Streptomyces sp. NBC_01092 TaxID=2903748 RepID=UPI00386859CA|nr:maleylpyruvate isomerase family mycothiol-dependent enzyme [Streptomyces sp. NBC_01092]